MTYTARISGIFAVLSLLLAVAGCSFDDDTAYIPRTQGVFLLIDSPTDGGEVICIRDSSIDYNLALEPQRIACMAGSGRKLWLGDNHGGKLYLYDCADMSLVRSFSLPDSLVPNSLVAQDDLVFSADENRHTVFACDDHGHLRAMRTLPGNPWVLAVHSGYVLACSYATVYWLNINDLSIRDSAVFRESVTGASWMPPESFAVFSRDSVENIYQATFSYQGKLISPETKQPGVSQIEYSPYRSQNFGHEYLRPVVAGIESASTPVGLLTGKYVMTDFFSPVWYSQQIDSGVSWVLKRLDADGETLIPLRDGRHLYVFSSHVYVDGDAAYGQP